MAEEEAVFEQTDRQHGADDPSQAARTPPMLQEPLIHQFAEQWNSAEDWMGHFSFSR
jgi:hypothetical protein